MKEISSVRLWVNRFSITLLLGECFLRVEIYSWGSNFCIKPFKLCFFMEIKTWKVEGYSGSFEWPHDLVLPHDFSVPCLRTAVITTLELCDHFTLAALSYVSVTMAAWHLANYLWRIFKICDKIIFFSNADNAFFFLINWAF